MVRAFFRFQIDRGFTPGQCASPLDPKEGRRFVFLFIREFAPDFCSVEILSHVKVASPFLTLWRGGEPSSSSKRTSPG